MTLSPSVKGEGPDQGKAVGLTCLIIIPTFLLPRWQQLSFKSKTAFVGGGGSVTAN